LEEVGKKLGEVRGIKGKCITPWLCVSFTISIYGMDINLLIATAVHLPSENGDYGGFKVELVTGSTYSLMGGIGLT